MYLYKKKLKIYIISMYLQEKKNFKKQSLSQYQASFNQTTMPQFWVLSYIISVSISISLFSYCLYVYTRLI